jgi:hypothetical protein
LNSNKTKTNHKKFPLNLGLATHRVDWHLPLGVGETARVEEKTCSTLLLSERQQFNQPPARSKNMSKSTLRLIKRKFFALFADIV